MGLNLEDLKKLAAPFPKNVLGVKVQSLSKDKTRALLVLYLQHTDVYNRIEEVDPGWESSVVSSERIGDIFVYRTWMKINGSCRENVGEGDTPKAALSDALKRTAMLFGVGRDLYDSETVWVPYNENTDRFKVFTIEDYEKNKKPVSGSSSPLVVAPVRPIAATTAAIQPPICQQCHKTFVKGKSFYFCPDFKDGRKHDRGVPIHEVEDIPMKPGVAASIASGLVKSMPAANASEDEAPPAWVQDDIPF